MSESSGGRRRWVYLLAFAHLCGAVSTIPALNSTRTPQGTVAWVMSLNTIPVLAVPAYWFFGRSEFRGYVESRRAGIDEVQSEIGGSLERLQGFAAERMSDIGRDTVLEHLAPIPFVQGNRVELLIDGQETFDHIIDGIHAAEEYVLVQFFIYRADELGRRLGTAMRDRARDGLDVFLLVDGVGSRDLPSTFVDSLESAGVHVEVFESARGERGLRQYQFRNHRKIVVADGRVAWTGGHNVGDEYMGRDPDYGPWRDTHVVIEGPAVLPLQLTFLQDWQWATGETLELDWSTETGVDDGEPILVVPSGPADVIATGSQMMQFLIHAAQERIWIATGYLVPDAGVMDALRMAAVRGVDVRLLIPAESDSFLVHHATFALLPDLLEVGIGVHHYTEGFMHQKVVLVDDRVATVGSLNLDHRSLRLNFEATAIVVGERFAGRVEEMLLADFDRAHSVSSDDLDARPWYRKAMSRLAYLAAPIL